MVKYSNNVEVTNRGNLSKDFLAICRDASNNLIIQISHVEAGKDRILYFQVAPEDEDILAAKFNLVVAERKRT